jgi:hypothetical protein
LKLFQELGEEGIKKNVGGDELKLVVFFCVT